MSTTKQVNPDPVSDENNHSVTIVTITAEELAERLKKLNHSERKRRIATRIEAIEDPVLRAAAKERAELKAKFEDE